ncbi:ProQ/FINO family protein [Vreelandella alkaliphila]|uniref:ABC transporter substrate-binding protein n=1 Tax=Vreelandella alkaliphila TaxID=272774 RepID=A0A7C9P0Z7_9GAMM|nr:ProQ/FINO family protein [Halomonas alkaliphila]NDL70413.1 ABC transporter substrate-binding protein [Halomonas alkaliphila]
MAASILQLIETLEAHLEQKNAELKALREENKALKQQLADQSRHPQLPAQSVEPHLAQPTPLSSAKEETEKRRVDGAPVGEKIIDEVPVDEVPVDKKEADDATVMQESPLPPSPQALLNQWYQRYPKAFFTGHTKPLKVGIHQDLAQREPWSGKLIRRALANYVNLPRYVKSMREGAERIDLEGHPAGKVDKEAARHANERRKDKSVNEASKGHVSKDHVSKAHVSKNQAAKQPPRMANKNPPIAQANDSEVPAAGGAQHGSSDVPRKNERIAPLSLEDKLKGLQEKFSGR